jgi:hypothetical protein
MTGCTNHEWMTPLPRRHDYCKHCGSIREEDGNEVHEALTLLVEFIEPVEGGSIFDPKRDMAHLHKLVGHARKALEVIQYRWTGAAYVPEPPITTAEAVARLQGMGIDVEYDPTEKDDAVKARRIAYALARVERLRRQLEEAKLNLRVEQGYSQ